MSKINVTLTINDKLWADFCIWLENTHTKSCKCKADPSQYLSDQLLQMLVEFKTNVLFKERVDGYIKAGLTLNQVMTLASRNEALLPEDQAELNRIEAEYEQ